MKDKNGPNGTAETNHISEIERMRIMLDAAPLATTVLNKNLQVIDCNQEALKIFGVSSKEEYFEKFFEMAPEHQPDGRLTAEIAAGHIQKAFDEGYCRVNEWMHKLPNGEPLPAEVTLVRVNYKGEDHVAGYTRDLREQKRMLQEIDNTAKEMRELSERVTLILDTNPHITILFNDKFEVMDCNPAAIKFMRFKTREEMLKGFKERINKDTREIYINGEKSESIADRLRAAVTEGRVKYETELIIEGERHSIDVEFIKIPYGDNFAIVAYVFDTTKILERESELASAREQMELQLMKISMAARATKIGLWDIVFLCDDPLSPENSFVWSDDVRKMLGFSNKKDFPDLLSSWSERLHPDDKEKIDNCFVKHIQDKTGNTFYDIEYRIKKKNGEYGYFRDSGETIRDESGKAIRSAGALMDITEMKKMLLENEMQVTKLRMAAKATKMALWDMEILNSNSENQKNIFNWSDVFKTLLGHSTDEVISDALTTLTDRIHPEDYDIAIGAFYAHLNDKTGQTPFDCEHRLKKKNGEYGYFRSTCEAMRDSEGNVLSVAGAIMDITETKKMITENELQIAKLNLAAKATKIGLWDMVVLGGDPVNPKNTFQWSSQFKSLLGYSDDYDFPNFLATWSDRLHPEDREMAVVALHSHLLDKTGKTPFDVEHRLIKKNREYGYFRATGEAIRDKEGNAIRAAGALMDITETKSMLLENELQVAKLDLAAKATKIGLWDMEVVNGDPVNPANIFIWSNQFKNLLGYPDDYDFPNVLNTWSDKLHPDDKDMAVSAFKNHLLDKTGKTPFDIEHRLLTKNGKYGYFRATGETVRDTSGNALRAAGALMDITETKKMLEYNQLQVAKLGLAAKATKIGLWDMEVLGNDPINPDNVFMWSEEFINMLGYSTDENFPAILTSWSDKLHPEDKKAAIEAFENHLLNKTSQTPFDVEHRLLKKNGEYAYFRATGETIRDENGNAIRAAGALMDISETKNFLLEIEKHRDEAETANKAKSTFLSTMSHEIRTPMNAILGITEIQLQNDDLDEKTRSAFDKIYASGDMLLGIINDILDLSKIEAGKLDLINAKYEIASLISDTAQLNMMRIGSKPIEFELEIDPKCPLYVLGDELRVKQILNNILSNAFKYTSAGTVRLSIGIKPVKGNKDDIIVIFSVSDTGQGMTKEQVDKLFDEYSRFNMKANRTTEGTGLGMSITRNLIRMMNGEISIDSEPGVGTTFTVHIPQIKVGSETLGKDVVENLHQFKSSSRAQMRRTQVQREHMPYGSVLIVDDVETNIYVAKGLLTPYGMKLESAESGFAAIEKIKNGKVYDIVFMDHMMPGMDGIEATGIIRSLGYNQPIVALTANAVAGQAEIFLGTGFDDFISKPIDVRQLNNVLNKLIRDKQLPEVLEAARRQAAEKKETLTESTKERSVDPQFAKIFLKDANKSFAILKKIEKTGTYKEEDLRTYTIHVHGMKSALANIGKMDLSAVAMKLESSARDGNTQTLTSETSAFLSSLSEVIKELAPKDDPENGDDTVDSDPEFLRKKLIAIKAACEEYDESEAGKIITGLKAKTWSKSTIEILDFIAEQLFISGFDEVIDMIDKFV
jgi:PAS domain S-box-containing protein